MSVHCIGLMIFRGSVKFDSGLFGFSLADSLRFSWSKASKPLSADFAWSTARSVVAVSDSHISALEAALSHCDANRSSYL